MTEQQRVDLDERLFLAIRATRYHEAGHVIIATALGRHIQTASVVPGELWSGITVSGGRRRDPLVPAEICATYAALQAEREQLLRELAEADRAAGLYPILLFQRLADRDAIEASMVDLLAGEAVLEQLRPPEAGYLAQHHDEIVAEQLAHQLAATSPRHRELVAVHSKSQPPDERRAFEMSEQLAGAEADLHYALMRAIARRMVREYWPEIEAFAEELRSTPLVDFETKMEGA